MPPVHILLVCAAVVALSVAGKQIAHGVKKADRKACQVLTLGHKCKPKPVDPPKP